MLDGLATPHGGEVSQGSKGSVASLAQPASRIWPRFRRYSRLQVFLVHHNVSTLQWPVRNLRLISCSAWMCYMGSTGVSDPCLYGPTILVAASLLAVSASGEKVSIKFCKFVSKEDGLPAGWRGCLSLPSVYPSHGHPSCADKHGPETMMAVTLFLVRVYTPVSMILKSVGMGGTGCFIHVAVVVAATGAAAGRCHHCRGRRCPPRVAAPFRRIALGIVYSPTHSQLAPAFSFAIGP